ncbi:MAG: uroporphyrinogen-III synthase [Actinobacteria bacterium]|nr:uroporphyrinogen-III synthase [Actinomycetota bacterium]
MNVPFRVVVTRPEGEPDSLAERLRELGCVVVSAPSIEIGPPRSYEDLDRLARRPDAAAWILFTSQHAVRHFVQRQKRLRRGAAVTLGGAKAAVVGRATAEIAQRAGIDVALTSSGRTGHDLAAEVAARASPGCTVVLVQAEDGRPEAAESLAQGGFDVRVVAAYRTRPAQVPVQVQAEVRAGTVNAIAFASPSSALSFAIALGGLANIPASVCVGTIGPTTAAACERAGRTPDVVAPASTSAALAQAMFAALRSAQRPAGSGPSR